MQETSDAEALAELPPSSKFVYYVLEREGSMTLKELTETTLLGARTARYGLDKLADAGLVRDAPALHDGRQSCYSVDDGDATGRSRHPETALLAPGALADQLDAFAAGGSDRRLLEVSESYDEGHLPGALELNPRVHFSKAGARVTPDRERVEALLGERGVTPDTTVVLYGDGRNADAAFVYWVLTYYGHADVRLLDGGKRYWVDKDYPLTTAVAAVSPTTYDARAPTEGVRVYRDDVREALATDAALVDVRSSEEYCGTTDAPARVNGHIPETVNVEWTSVLDDEGRFRPPAALRAPFDEAGVGADHDVIVYCNFGERSALVWFALSELLGYDAVANYDGSWTEWGNLVDVPVETCDTLDAE